MSNSWFIVTACVLAILGAVYVKSFVLSKEPYAEMPVSEFTYEYMLKNMGLRDQNALYPKLVLMTRDENMVAKRQPEVTAGTLMDAPKTYKTWW